MRFVTLSETKHLFLTGGTVDITVHRKEVNGSLSSLHAATGGPWGGQMVTKEFVDFITEIVGNEVIDIFRMREIGDFFDLLRDFETKKRIILPEKDADLFIRIPSSLKEIYEERGEKSFKEAVQNSRYCQSITLMRDKLKVNKHLIIQMFKTSINATINHVSELLDEPGLRNVDRILLVGGYSECPLILKAFCDKFKQKRIINPHQVGLAVIKGAVQFGHNPAVISSRVLSYTYGTDISPEFEEGIYLEEMKFFDDEGTCRCKDVFSVFKRKGDSTELGEKVLHTFRPITKSQSSMSFPVNSSSDQDPSYKNDCKKLGSISLELPPYTGKERNVAVEFVFGLTELMVEITSETTGEKKRKYFNLPE